MALICHSRTLLAAAQFFDERFRTWGEGNKKKKQRPRRPPPARVDNTSQEVGSRRQLRHKAGNVATVFQCRFCRLKSVKPADARPSSLCFCTRR